MGNNKLWNYNSGCRLRKTEGDGTGERTPSAVEPSVEPEASPEEKSPRSQPSMTSNSAPVSAVMVVATVVLKQLPSSRA